MKYKTLLLLISRLLLSTKLAVAERGMGCASSNEAAVVSAASSAGVNPASSRSGSSTSKNRRASSVDAADDLQSFTGRRQRAQSPEANALVSSNLIDFLADQMGEADPKESLAEKFRELYSAIFATEWDAARLSDSKIAHLDQMVLEKLQTLFKQGPKLSKDMVRWKYNFKMDQPVPSRSIDLKGRVGVNFPHCTLVHAFCALGFVQSLDFILLASSLIASPERTLKVAMHTPLETAARFGRLRVVKLLVEKYNVDALEVFDANNSGAGTSSQVSSPLIRAVAEGQANVVEYLLHRGADPKQWMDVQGSGGQKHMSMIRLALGRALNDYERVVELLLKADAEQNMGVFTVRKGEVEKILETPLMTAAMLRNTDIMKTLIRLGADPHIANEQNKATLLHVAAAVPDNGRVLRFIIENIECDPLQLDSKGATPWLVAKDVSEDDGGANARVLGSLVCSSYRNACDKSTECKYIEDLSALVDAPRLPNGDITIGDFVRLDVSYRFNRIAKAGLRTKEPFFACVEAARDGTLDVRIDDVLTLGSDALSGANFGDILQSVSLVKVQQVIPAAQGHPYEH